MEKAPERAYLNFVNTLRTPETKRGYSLSLMQYKEFSKAGTYADLLKEKNLLKIQDKIISWIEHLKDGGNSASSIRTKSAGVQHFYTMNDKVLNWKKIKKYIGKVERSKDRLYTKEEMRRILDKCDERKRVMIFLLLAGLRIGALPGLYLKDIHKHEDEGVYRLTVYSGSSDEYYTFTTPEGARAIDSYLAYRKLKGDPLEPSAPLLREQFAEEDADKPRPMSLYSIEATLNRVLFDSGVRVKNGKVGHRHDVMRFHAFRKFFNTMLEQAGVKPITKELLMGHRAGLDASYLRPRPEELLSEYLKAADLLTISEEKALQLEIERLRVKREDLDFLKHQYLTEKAAKVQSDDAVKIVSDQVMILRKQIAEMKKQMEEERNKNNKQGSAAQTQEGQALPMDQRKGKRKAMQ